MAFFRVKKIINLVRNLYSDNPELVIRLVSFFLLIILITIYILLK